MPEPTGWDIAIAVNAVIKGLLGSMGESGHVCARTIDVAAEIDTRQGYEATCDTVAGLLTEAVPGDIVVVADKVLALAQGRIGPPEILTSPDPKTVDAAVRRDLARRWSEHCGFDISGRQLLLADEYEDPDDGPRSVLSCADHNQAAADLARAVARRTGKTVDVVISDTDTGLDVREPLIETVTFGATPLGATAGLTLYECMRCAAAAEFARGHRRRIPVVICRPARRCAQRSAMGQHRGYAGLLDARRESGLTYA